MSGTLDLIAEHSNHTSRATTSFRAEIKDSMLSESGLRGGGETVICPFMKVAFSNTMNPDYEEDDADSTVGEEDGKTTMFDHGWDGELVFTDTKTVSENQINKGLVAGYIAPGTTTPQVVPLEFSLARKDGKTWKKFDPAEIQLPTEFITDCFTPAVRDELKRIRENDPLRLKEPVSPSDRSEMAVIAILCDTHFPSMKTLNKHTEKMHGSMSL